MLQTDTLSCTFIVNEPALKPPNTLDTCQVVPLSFEYFKLVPLAVTLIVPSFNAGQLDTEGSVFATDEMLGVAGCAANTEGVAVDTQALALSFTTT